ncbi:MAG TPA: hypothetical protein VMB75_04180 [Rhodocyclaceae bacterium]|nr:hypothetical protein [Rhodocyclaceae bacterium]
MSGSMGNAGKAGSRRGHGHKAKAKKSKLPKAPRIATPLTPFVTKKARKKKPPVVTPLTPFARKPAPKPKKPPLATPEHPYAVYTKTPKKAPAGKPAPTRLPPPLDPALSPQADADKQPKAKKQQPIVWAPGGIPAAKYHGTVSPQAGDVGATPPVQLMTDIPSHGWSDVGTRVVVRGFCTPSQIQYAKGPLPCKRMTPFQTLHLNQAPHRLITPSEPLTGWTYDPMFPNNDVYSDRKMTGPVFDKLLLFNTIDYLNGASKVLFGPKGDDYPRIPYPDPEVEP